MLKKLLTFVLLTPSLCIAAPKYKISDANVRKWIIEGNKAEQCLFPNMNSVSPTPTTYILHKRYVYELPLIKVIGLQNTNTIFSDIESGQYLERKFRRFNHAKPATFSSEWCENLKQQYARDIPAANQWIAQQEALQKQAQQAQEEQARQAFYATPQGQAYLAQQQLLQQQQNAQQQAYYNQQQILEQQRLERERQERNQAWQDLGNTIQQSVNSLTNTMQNNTQMLNNMNNQMMQNNQQMMQNWGSNRGGSVTCYKLGTGITHCNY